MFVEYCFRIMLFCFIFWLWCGPIQVQADGGDGEVSVTESSCKDEKELIEVPEVCSENGSDVLTSDDGKQSIAGMGKKRGKESASDSGVEPSAKRKKTVTRFRHLQSLKNRLSKVNHIIALHPGCQRLEGKYAVVGDIHGDYDVFKAVIDVLQRAIDSNEIDGVVFLGDFWDRKDGDVQVFEELIEFLERNNTDVSYKVVVLSGNHEMIGSRWSSGAHYFDYARLLPTDVLVEVEKFHQLLPFNVIINDNTYLTHAGMPCIPNMASKDVMSLLLSTDRNVYPNQSSKSTGNIVYSALWSDFAPNLRANFITNTRRGCNNFEACYFGERILDFYRRGFNELNSALKIKNYIFAHDHYKGGFSQIMFGYELENREPICVTTVITAPYLTQEIPDMSKRFGAVALVDPKLPNPVEYIRITMDNKLTKVIS